MGNCQQGGPPPSKNNSVSHPNTSNMLKQKSVGGKLRISRTPHNGTLIFESGQHGRDPLILQPKQLIVQPKQLIRRSPSPPAGGGRPAD